MDEPATADARQQMMSWLLGEEANKAARAELRRYGLDLYDPTDLLNDVAVRVLQLDPHLPIDNPTGYARRAVTNRARDLLSADKVRRRHLTAPIGKDGDDDRDVTDDVPDPGALDPAVVAAVDAAEDDLRRALQLALDAQRAWVAAAAMATLTLTLHLAVARPDGAPEPAVGTPGQADRWAALWLAGERSAFADPSNATGGKNAEDQAMRKARSRKLKEVDALLVQMASAVLGGLPRG
jgi:DNA-directed RNA polymerase specialized sigma24 family protein